jgi:hypothetical protein
MRSINTSGSSAHQEKELISKTSKILNRHFYTAKQIDSNNLQILFDNLLMPFP